MTRPFNVRDFAPDLADAARTGPVTITDRGQPAYVLLSYEEYSRLSASQPGRTLTDMLACPDFSEIDLMNYIPPRKVEPWREIDFD